MIEQSVLGRHSRTIERIPSNQINGSDISTLLNINMYIKFFLDPIFYIKIICTRKNESRYILLLIMIGLLHCM